MTVMVYTYSTHKGTIMNKLLYLGTMERRRTVFLSDKVVLKCPFCSIAVQRWTRTYDQNGTRINGELLTANNESMPEYNINDTQISDEGMYECSEENKTLIIVTLEIEGKIQF